MSVIERIGEWWARSTWGWLVVAGPMLCYLTLLFSLDVVGLGASNPYHLPIESADAFLPPKELVLNSIAGRLEYGIVSSIFLLVASFSIIWSVPRIIGQFRNPFGGFTGLLLSVGVSLALYYGYLISDYNLRQVFADDILVEGEKLGVISKLFLDIEILGVDVVVGAYAPSEILATTRDAVYLVGNMAPWCLIVLAARCASYAPRALNAETHESLRARITILQIAVFLAAANIVLSVAYTRAMVSWPPALLEDPYAQSYALAINRYSALWGALGTVLLITALAPAYISLNRHFDRIALRELGGDSGRKVSYQERMLWREKHGLMVSAQQVLTTGAAVIAPVMTGPTLDATVGGVEVNDPPAIVQTEAAQ